LNIAPGLDKCCSLWAPITVAESLVNGHLSHALTVSAGKKKSPGNIVHHNRTVLQDRLLPANGTQTEKNANLVKNQQSEQ
jgi:hypothetical protein